MKNKLRKALPFMLAASLALGAAPGIGALVDHAAEAASVDIKGDDNTSISVPGGISNTINISMGGKGSRYGYPCHVSKNNDNQIAIGESTQGYYAYVLDPKNEISKSIRPVVSSYGNSYSIMANLPALDNESAAIVVNLPFCTYENCDGTHDIGKRGAGKATYWINGVRGEVSNTYTLELDGAGGFKATYDTTGGFTDMNLVTASGGSINDLGIEYFFAGGKLIIQGDSSNKLKPDTDYSFRFVSTSDAGRPVGIASNTFSLRIAKKAVGNLSNTAVVPAGTIIGGIDLPKLPKGVKINDYKKKSISINGVANTNLPILQNGMFARVYIRDLILKEGETRTVEISLADNPSYGDCTLTTTVSPQKISAAGLTSRRTFSVVSKDYKTDFDSLGIIKDFGLFNPDVLDASDRGAFKTYLSGKLSGNIEVSNGRTTPEGMTYTVTQKNTDALIGGFAAQTISPGYTYGDKYNFPGGGTISGTLNVYSVGAPNDFTILTSSKEESITVYPEDGAVSRTLNFEVINNDGAEVSYQWYLDDQALSLYTNYGVFGSGERSSISLSNLAAFVNNGDYGDDHIVYCKAVANGKEISSEKLFIYIRYIKGSGGGSAWNSGGTAVSGNGGGGSYTAIVTDQNGLIIKNNNTIDSSTNTSSDIKAYQAQYSHPGAGTASKMNRLLSISSGEHLFTTNGAEVANLLRNGWKSEDIKGKSVGEETGDPVYRVYNSVTKEHLYTMSLKEKNYLVTNQKWKYEGIQFFSGGKTALTRLYNPNAKELYNCHLLTSDENEIKTLTAKGWINEGLTWSLDTDN